MVANDRDLGLLFDAVAEEYDAVRPRYPEALFDDLLALTPLAPGVRVLEIGCGTGIATRSLLARGLRVLAIEPGPEMARIARRASPEERLSIEPVTFEEWEPSGPRFSGVFSATAFHWIDPKIRWAKTASLLEDDGCLALATNRTVDGGGFAELYDASRELHRRFAPDMADEGPSPTEESLRSGLEAATFDLGALWGVADPKGGDGVAAPLFEPPVLRTYVWEQGYRISEAVSLLSTFSPYLALAEPDRVALLRGIEAVADERFDGTVTRRYLSILAVARKAVR